MEMAKNKKYIHLFFVLRKNNEKKSDFISVGFNFRRLPG